MGAIWPIGGRRGGRYAWPAALLVLGLLVAHLLLMSHEPRHDDHHGGHGAVAAVDPPSREGDAPRSVLDGCPVAQAILPGLLLLLVLAGLLLVRPRGAPRGIVRARRSPPRSLPPPLAARDRRALLQVFLI